MTGLPARDLLLSTAARRELHHAIILHGASPNALEVLAREIARNLICLSGSGDDGCGSCHKLDRNSHPDLHIVSLEGDRKSISTDQVREVLTGAVMRPYEGASKVYIIHPAEAMTPQAANALLKTLEEPVAETTFILLTRSTDLLLPTIRSRSQSVAIVGDERNPSVELETVIEERLSDFVSSGEPAILLSLAATLCEDAAWGLVALATVLRRIAGGQTARDTAIREMLGVDRVLAAATSALRSAQRLTVNIDARLAVEAPLIELLREKTG